MNMTHEYGQGNGQKTGAKVPVCPYSAPKGAVEYGQSNGHWADFGRNTGRNTGRFAPPSLRAFAPLRQALRCQA